jgi:hypothetical protein
MGACGPATELVGRLLQEHFGIEAVYVCGDNHLDLRSKGQTHAWVEAAGYIIDVTHDQFGATGVAGWVAPMPSTCHERFRSVDRREGFCMPSGWHMYPHDGYVAMTQALNDPMQK